MKANSGLLWMGVVVGAVLFAGCSGGNAGTAVDRSAEGVGVVEKIAAGDFAGVVAMFDATMTSALPEATLRQTWEGLTSQVGAYREHGAARSATEMGFGVVYVPCTFERGSLTAKVVFDSQGKISGLFFQ